MRQSHDDDAGFQADNVTSRFVRILYRHDVVRSNEVVRAATRELFGVFALIQSRCSLAGLSYTVRAFA